MTAFTAVRLILSAFLVACRHTPSIRLIHCDSSHSAKAVFHTSHKHKKVEVMQPCDTEYPSFIYTPSVKETNSFVQCGRCHKMFVMQQIANSNLLMLVVQGECDCARRFPPITLEPKEVKYNTSVKCDRMRSQKLRRRPDSCHAFHPEENAEDCGGASEISLSVTLFMTTLIASLVLR